MKKYISVLLVLMIPFTALYATSVDEEISNLVNISLQNNIDYLNAKNDLKNSQDDLEQSPAILDSSISSDSSVSYSSSSTTFVSSLDVSIPLIDQLTLSASVDTNLDGSVGLTYNPLASSDSTVPNEINLENASVNLNEVEESLKVDIAQAYINYLLAIEDLNQQEAQVTHDQKEYEQQKELYDYQETTLIDLQDSLMSYTESKNKIKDLELAVYSTKVTLYQLIGVSDYSSIELVQADLNQLVDLNSDLETVLDGKSFSPLSDKDVVAALNSTALLEDSYNTLKLYSPTFSINTKVKLDGTVSAGVSFKTSAADYNGDEKEDLLNQIDLSKIESAQTISKVTSSIELLQNTVASDKQSISDIEMQIEQNNLVMNEAKALLDLGEYESLDYETLELNANNLQLSLIKAYATLYVDQLKLINYL
ncbi:MAG: TolC family protein [Pleomorphochaeta sp.]